MIKLKQQKNLTRCKTSFNKITSNFKMSTILTAYTLCTLGITFTILLITQQIQLSYTTNQVQKLSQQSLILQNQNAIMFQSFETMKVLESAFSLITSKMSKLVLLNYWSNLQNYTIENLVLLCNLTQQFQSYLQKSSLCLTFFKEIDEIQLKNNDYIKFLNLFNQFQLVFDFQMVSEQLYFISFIDNLLTSYYPTKKLDEKSDLIQEQWFLNLTTELKTKQKYIPFEISSLYQKDNYNYLLAQFSMLFINKKHQITGIGSLIINFPGFRHFIYMDRLNLMILQDDGLLVYSKSYLNHPMNSDIHYIYDENLTGFNISDWNDMIQSINQTNLPLYKYNSKLKQNVYVKTIKLLNTPLIQIILSNNTYEDEMKQVLYNEFGKIQSWYTNINIYSIFGNIIIIILGIIPLKLIFKKSNLVLDMMIKYLKGQFNYKLRDDILGQNIFKSSDNCLNSLYEAYEKIDKIINNSQFKKSEECQIIESFRFYRNEKAKLHIPTETLQNNNNQINQKELINIIRCDIWQ